MKMNDLVKKFRVQDMRKWKGLDADLVITDPPFGIKFNGKNTNYNRNSNLVVDGYVEWDISEYPEKMRQLLDVIRRNIKENGQALIFSGWNNSNIIHDAILDDPDFTLQGKMYWIYNFAPASRKRPSHNVYEIFWITRGKTWIYNNRCTTYHCQEGEPNLSSFLFKRDYKVNMPKYPTRLPFKLLQSLIEHFSNKGDLIFDPLAGSGMVGIVSYFLGRDFVLGDLNENARKVYMALLKYYLGTNGKTDKLETWWIDG